MDCVYIRVHGPIGRTKLLYQLISNQEHIYDDSSTFIKFHTTSPNAGQILLAAHMSAMKANPSPILLYGVMVPGNGRRMYTRATSVKRRSKSCKRPRRRRHKMEANL
jgi:hypothetical protein